MVLAVKDEELTALIQSAIDGDKSAFEKLVSVFTGYILNFVSPLAMNKNEIEDISQEVVIQMFRTIRRLKSPYAFTSWLGRLMLNVVNNYNDKHSRHTKFRADYEEAEDATKSAETDDPYKEAVRAEGMETMLGLIEELPRAQRETLYLYYYQDMSYKEISKTLGITTATVGTNIIKAKARLVEMIQKDKHTIETLGLDEKRFGQMVAGSFALGGQGVATDVAAESLKGFAHTAINNPTVTQLPPTAKADFLTKLAVGIGGLTICASIGLTLVLAPPAAEPTPEAQPPATAPAAYTAEGVTISFVTEDGLDSNVNPIGVNIVIPEADDDVTVDGYTISTGDGPLAISGNGSTINLADLETGEYEIEYSITLDGSTAKVIRNFYITE
jgi:RNA polymerase sigma-70 factor (ECF subfamily)